MSQLPVAHPGEVGARTPRLLMKMGFYSGKPGDDGEYLEVCSYVPSAHTLPSLEAEKGPHVHHFSHFPSVQAPE